MAQVVQVESVLVVHVSPDSQFGMALQSVITASVPVALEVPGRHAVSTNCPVSAVLHVAD